MDNRTETQREKRFRVYLFGISLNEKRGIYTYTLPTCWASYLINGDSSGLSDKEIKECNEYTKLYGDCLDVSEYSHFGIFKGMGYDLSEYKFKSPK